MERAESTALTEAPATTAELALFVSCHAGSSDFTTLQFKVHSEALGLLHGDFGSKQISSDSLRYFDSFFEKVEDVYSLTSAVRTKAEQLIHSHGVALFRTLLPDALREALWELLDDGRTWTLQIISEESWIPWEMLCFFGRRSNTQAVGPYWGEAFNVVRWLRGPAPPKDLTLSRMALVTSNEPGLHGARAERDFLLSLDKKHRRVKEIPARVEVVTQSLADGRHDAWHFACHGGIGRSAAESWQLRLGPNEHLTPAYLQGNASGLGASSPLVVLNACKSGRGGPGLASIDGWAAGFVRAGAGAFVAPLWSIPDTSAEAFSRTFYRKVLQGKTLGEAVRLARLAIREGNPGDPTGLSYAIYAHPSARISPRLLPKPSRRRKNAKRSLNIRSNRDTNARTVHKVEAPEPQVASSGSGKERVCEQDGSILVRVPGGFYAIGTNDRTDAARPIHRVQLSPFWIHKYPVTNEQYARFLNATTNQPDPRFWHDNLLNRPRQPVVGVRRDQALAYCRWAGLQLPTEAQWEAAARGLEGRRFPWGNSLPTPTCCNFGRKAGGTTDVDAYPAGAGPFGTFDQAGNVWEWCLDSWSRSAYKERIDGELNPLESGDDSYCVVRGGSWLNPAQDLLSAAREAGTASQQLVDQGFRGVLQDDQCPTSSTSIETATMARSEPNM